MERISKQQPRDPVGVDSFIFDPEVTTPEPPEHMTGIPDGLMAEKAGWLKVAEAWFEKALFVSIIAFGLCLAAVMFIQVLLRYVFASPFVGIEELALLFGAWFYFLGLMYVTRNGEHIHGGILTLVVGNRNTIRVVRFIMTILSVAACAVFGYYAIKYATFEIQTGRLSSYMRWPKGLWSTSLIVGFIGTIAYLVLQAANQFLDIRARLRSGTD